MDDRGCPVLIQGRPLWVCMETDMICRSLAKRLAYGVLQGCVYLGEGRMVRELSGHLLGGEASRKEAVGPPERAVRDSEPRARATLPAVHLQPH